MIYYEVAFETTNCLRPCIQRLFAWNSATTWPIISNACSDLFSFWSLCSICRFHWKCLQSIHRSVHLESRLNQPSKLQKQDFELENRKPHIFLLIIEISPHCKVDASSAPKNCLFYCAVHEALSLSYAAQLSLLRCPSYNFQELLGGRL
jgi:hypothetical protein